MKESSPKSIGIIGGAGPMAGALMMHKIVSLCQKKYGCIDDQDFPKLILLSYPFSEMLKPSSSLQRDDSVTRELNQSVKFLLKSRCDYIVIACNTLHGYLSEEHRSLPYFIDLIFETEKWIAKRGFSEILVLCTGTTIKKQIYERSCLVHYSSLDNRSDIDQIIRDILKGAYGKKQADKLKEIIFYQKNQYPSIDAVVLGCTELSVLLSEHSLSIPEIVLIDPLEIVASVLCAKVFEGRDMKNYAEIR